MTSTHRYLMHLDVIDHVQAEFESRMRGASLREVRLLDAIGRQPMIIKAVADKRAVAPQGVGRQLQRLQGRGLIAIARYERDKRAKIATITDAGREIIARAESILLGLVGDLPLHGDGLDGAEGVSKRA